MKKFLFGGIIGFLMGVYSLLTLVLSNKRIRNFIKVVTADELTKQAEKILYGEGIRQTPLPHNAPRTTYPTYYRKRSRSNRGYKSYNFQNKEGPYQFIFSTKEEAEEVLEQLQGVIEAYSAVTIGDLHDLVGFPKEREDNKRGWGDLRGALIRQDRIGYVLDLPEPEPIAS